MELITRTIYGGYIQTTQLLGLPYEMVPFTTLNERFDILKDVAPPSTQIPTLGYWTIGAGGHRFDCAAGGIPKPEPIQHQATDASCFTPIPFALVLPSEDVEAGDRARLCLRKEMQVNGRTMVAYYGRKMDKTGVQAQMQIKTINNGESATIAFVPNSSNLNPTPQELDPTGVNEMDGQYAVVTAKLNISLTPRDARYLVQMATELFGDPNFAIISEIALFSGLPQNVTVNTPGGGSYQFWDVKAAQVNSFINSFYPMAYSNNGMELLLDVGCTEPLLRIKK